MWVLVATGPVRGLVPWVSVGTMTGVVVGCVALAELFGDQVPWPFLVTAGAGLVLLVGRLLRLPGTTIPARRRSTMPDERQARS
jgi:hypothetical protein